jgi:hypothetical protein
LVDTQADSTPMLPLIALEQRFEEEGRTSTPTPNSLVNKALQKSEALLAALVSLGLSNEDEDERVQSPKRRRSMISTSQISACLTSEGKDLAKTTQSGTNSQTIGPIALNVYEDKSCQTEVSEPDPEASVDSRRDEPEPDEPDPGAASTADETDPEIHRVSSVYVRRDSICTSPTRRARDVNQGEVPSRRQNLLRRSHSDLAQLHGLAPAQHSAEAMYQRPVSNCILDLLANLLQDKQRVSIRVRKSIRPVYTVFVRHDYKVLNAVVARNDVVKL